MTRKKLSLGLVALLMMLSIALVAAPIPAAACEGVGCDGGTVVVGDAGGIVDIELTADNLTPWVFDDGPEDPVNVTGYMVVDAYAYAYANGWAVSWEDWKWNWWPKYVETYAGAFAKAGASADFWYYIQATHPNGNILYYDTDYFYTADWDKDKDFSKDSDWWWLWWGNDIVAYANAEAYAESPLYLYIPIDFSFVPNQPGVYEVYAYGDSWLQYMADAGYCTEFGCFGYDEYGKLVIIWDEAYLRIIAIDYPNVPMGRFDIHEAKDTVIEVYNIDGGGLQPWAGGHAIYEMWTEDSAGTGAYQAPPFHLQSGTAALIWSWTPANGHQIYGSYVYEGSMRLSGWQQDLWKDGDQCWKVVGGATYCPMDPTVEIVNAIFKIDPAAGTKDMRDSFIDIVNNVYGMQTQLGRALTTSEYEAAVASVLS